MYESNKYIPTPILNMYLYDFQGTCIGSSPSFWTANPPLCFSSSFFSLTNHNSISFSFLTTSPFYPLVVPSTLLLYTIPTFSSFIMSFPLQLGGVEEHYNLPQWVTTARWFLVLDAAKKSDFDEWCYNLTAMCFIHDHSCYFSFHVCFKFQSCLYCICLARIALS